MGFSLSSGVSGASTGFAIGGPVGAAIGGIFGGIFGSDSESENAEEQQRVAWENYQIQAGYREDLLVYAGHQEAFAAERQAYANASYSIAVANRNAEIQFREQEVYNKKLAATTEYKAQTHVANILKEGANSQAKLVIADTLRVSGANTRNTTYKADKMMGTAIARSRSGLAQGRSKDRIVADMFLQRGKAIGEQDSKTRASMLQTIQARDKVTNDANLKLGESYRGLQAVMRLEAAPVANVAPPTPVFDYVQPVAPLGAAPGEYTSPNAIDIGLGALGGLKSSTLSGIGDSFSNLGTTFEGPTLPGGESGYYDWGH